MSLVVTEGTGFTVTGNLVGANVLATNETRLSAVEDKAIFNQVNVKDYGAIGDGVTDDSAAFISAIAAGGIVYIPEGYTFLLTENFTITNSEFKGFAGFGTLKFDMSESSTKGIIIDGLDDVTVKNITIEYSTDVTERNNNSFGLKFNGCNDINVLDIKIKNAVGQGITLTSCVGGTVAFSEVSKSNSDGIHLASSSNIKIIGNDVSYSGDDGISCMGYSDLGYCENNLVAFNIVHDGGSPNSLTTSSQTGGGITAGGCKNHKIIGNDIEGAFIRLRCDSGTGYDILDLDGCIITDNTIHDVDVTDESNWLGAFTIRGSKVDGAVKNVIFSNNIIKNASYYYIYITSTYTTSSITSDIKIVNNKFIGVAGTNNSLKSHGVYIAGVDRVVVDNNEIEDSFSSAISIQTLGSGVGEIASIKNNLIKNPAIYDGTRASIHSTINYTDIIGNKVDDPNANNSGYIINYTGNGGIIKNNHTIQDPYILTINVSGQPTEYIKNRIIALSATPTTGTWGRGDRIEYPFPSASGSMGEVCTFGGTFGTLSSVTATITDGSPNITVNDATNISRGMRLAIVDATGTYVVKKVSGTTVTLTSNISTASAGSGKAVSYYAPTFKTFGAIAS